MSADQCQHCGAPLPTVQDAFCPYCHEPLDEIPSGHETTARTDEPQLTGTITVDVKTEFPRLCILCGQESQRFVRIRFHREHTVKKSLLRAIVGGGWFGMLIADAVFYKRPVDLLLPVCAMHINDPRLKSITGIPTGSRRLAIAGIHPAFVTTINERMRNEWTELAQRMSAAENRREKAMDNANQIRSTNDR